MEVWAEGVASSVRVHARGQVCTVKYVHCQVCMRAGVQLSSMFTVKCVKLIHATVKYVHCQVRYGITFARPTSETKSGPTKETAISLCLAYQ